MALKLKISKTLSKLPTVDYRELTPLQGNLKDLSVANYNKLKKSLTEFGFIVPIFIWKHEGKIFVIDAHQRLRVLTKEKAQPFMIPYVDIEANDEIEARQKLLVISSQYGKITQEGYDEFIVDIPDDFLMETVNFDALYIPIEEETQEAKEDDYVIPDEIKTDIKIGDLFEIGRHRLLCGDSTQTDTFERLMGEELADLVITEPPYNIDYKGGANGHKIKNDKQSDANFYQFLYDFYTALGSFTKSGGVWYVWHNEKECVNFYTSFKDAGLEWGKTLIWNKNNLGMGSDYRNKHEPCIYGWKTGEKHKWYSDKSQTTVLNFDRPTRNTEHPTMKPIPLIAYQIGNSSKADDIVCDGFGGSGTTMVCCQQMDRKGYVVEFDPKYCQVIIDRMLKLVPDIKITKNGKPYKPAIDKS